MNDLRPLRSAFAALLLAACSSPAPHGVDDAELAAVAPLKQRYDGIVMGFDIKPATTLVVSLDLQAYTDADDDTVAALKREALARWRAAWVAAHPRERAVLHLRFIDFIGRKVATEETKV
ncbi:MAG TPA: hypothetical protein VFE16_05145 [Candidatus Cybelea sp.]|jgi:hypothetical protein|nr:hypothetical protein [Candidatus Cybelea sp.]